MSIDVALGQKVTEELLEHHGVKGQKWGVRRTDAQLSKAGKGKSDDSDEKPKKGVVGKTKTSRGSADEMSDALLKKVNNRLNMEKQYAQLTAKPPSTGQKLMATATKVLTDTAVGIARQQLSKVGNDIAADQIAKMMGKSGSVDAVAKVIPKLPPTQGPLRPPGR